jgi:hypothetical protein
MWQDEDINMRIIYNAIYKYYELIDQHNHFVAQSADKYEMNKIEFTLHILCALATGVAIYALIYSLMN